MSLVSCARAPFVPRAASQRLFRTFLAFLSGALSGTAGQVDRSLAVTSVSQLVHASDKIRLTREGVVDQTFVQEQSF